MFEFLGATVGPWAAQFVGWAVVAGIPLIAAPVSAFIFRKLQQVGINIDAQHRQSYTDAATRAAGNLVHLITGGQVSQADIAAQAAGGPVPPVVGKLVADVQAAAPDALKHFGITNNVAAIASKIIGIAGALMAPGTAGIAGVVTNLFPAPISSSGH